MVMLIWELRYSSFYRHSWLTTLIEEKIKFKEEFECLFTTLVSI